MSRVPAGSDALLGTQIGSWRLARLIGAGGMGRVYLGVQPEIGGRVAIKVLKDAGDADLVERFFNEARAVNLIRHEGIVDVIDLGRHDGAPYIVMEYLEGAPLKAYVKREPRPPAGAMARVIGEVLAALEAAHAKAIIHRDLKPDNIFVSPGGRVTVLDFGIAKLAGDLATGPTRTGGLLGTPAYMAPEQARSQPVDARADLYSVGVILYEAATGVLPFTAPSLYELLDQHVKQTPKPPRSIDPAIPDALEAVILRALAKDPNDRFATAADMRAALADAIAHLPAAELQLPAIAPEPRSGKTLDPDARTQASVAFAETRPSEQPEPRGSAPTVDRSVRVSRVLVGAMAASSLLGIAAVVVVVMRDRDEPQRAATPAPSMIDAVSIDASPDAAIVIDDPIDAPTIDAAVKIAKQPPPKVEAPADFSNGPIGLTIPKPASFDPAAYYKTALAKAQWAAGEGGVRPTKITWRRFDRKGRMDLTAGATAEYSFVALRPKDDYCYISLFIESPNARMAVGKPASGNCGGGVRVPECSLAQLWEKAIADGVPESATHGSINAFGREIVFSVEGHPTTHYLRCD